MTDHTSELLKEYNDTVGKLEKLSQKINEPDTNMVHKTLIQLSYTTLLSYKNALDLLLCTELSDEDKKELIDKKIQERKEEEDNIKELEEEFNSLDMI